MGTSEIEGVAHEPGADGLTLVVPGRTVGAGEGWHWVTRGWRLFTRAPLMWVISVVLVFVAALVLNVVPIVGSIVFQFLATVIMAGYVVACRSLEEGGDFELEHLLAGFQRHFGALLAVSALVMLAWLVIGLVFAMFVGFGILGSVLGGDVTGAAAALMASIGSILVGMLVALALMIPVLAAYWFAPALVVMHGMPALEALKASLVATLRNFIPFLVYGIVMTVGAVLAAIPFFLGYLAWIPVAIASTYVAYRDIFTAEPPAPAARVEV